MQCFSWSKTNSNDVQLGSITQNGKTLNFLVDNLGNIVQEVVGAGGDALSQIIGNFKVISIIGRFDASR